MSSSGATVQAIFRSYRNRVTRKIFWRTLNCYQTETFRHIVWCAGIDRKGRRNCPCCGGNQRHRFYSAQVKRLLPVPYYQLTFAVPEKLFSLARQNDRAVNDLFFRVVRINLEKAARPRGIEQIGALQVIHPCASNLANIVHMHVLMPAGGLSRDGRWIPWKVCHSMKDIEIGFRDDFLDGLRRLYEEGKLKLRGKLSGLDKESGGFKSLLLPASKSIWKCYAERIKRRAVKRHLKYLASKVSCGPVRDADIALHENGEVMLSMEAPRRTIRFSTEVFIKRYLQQLKERESVLIRRIGFEANGSNQGWDRARTAIQTRREEREWNIATIKQEWKARAVGGVGIGV